MPKKLTFREWLASQETDGGSISVDERYAISGTLNAYEVSTLTNILQSHVESLEADISEWDAGDSNMTEMKVERLRDQVDFLNALIAKITFHAVLVHPCPTQGDHNESSNPRGQSGSPARDA